MQWSSFASTLAIVLLPIFQMENAVTKIWYKKHTDIFIFFFFFFHRLRCLVKQLEKGDINVVDLKKNIEYAASVLEAVYIDETR